MKKQFMSIFFFIIAGLMLGVDSPASWAADYTVGTRGTNRPYSIDDTGKLTGFDIELLREIEKRIPDVQFKFETMAISTAFINLDSKKIDLLACQMTKNPDRAAKYIFTKNPNNYTSTKLVVHEDRHDINSVEDLQGKTMACVTTDETARFIAELNKTFNPKIKLLYTDAGADEIFNLVATKRADAGMDYSYAVEDVRKTLGLKIKTVGKVYLSDPT